MTYQEEKHCRSVRTHSSRIRDPPHQCLDLQVRQQTHRITAPVAAAMLDQRSQKTPENLPLTTDDSTCSTHRGTCGHVFISYPMIDQDPSLSLPRTTSRFILNTSPWYIVPHSTTFCIVSILAFIDSISHVLTLLY